MEVDPIYLNLQGASKRQRLEPESFLTKPKILTADQDQDAEYPRQARKRAKYEADDQAFIKGTGLQLSHQYFELYSNRTNILRPDMEKKASAKWPSM